MMMVSLVIWSISIKWYFKFTKNSVKYSELKLNLTWFLVLLFYLDEIKNKCQIKHIFKSPGFLIADLWIGLCALIQKKMSIVNFVKLLLAF